MQYTLAFRTEMDNPYLQSIPETYMSQPPHYMCPIFEKSDLAQQGCTQL